VRHHVGIGEGEAHFLAGLHGELLRVIDHPLAHGGDANGGQLGGVGQDAGLLRGGFRGFGDDAAALRGVHVEPQMLHGARGDAGVRLGGFEQLGEQLAKLQRGGKSETLRWIRAQAGKTLRLIAIDDVDFLRSDAKYTIVAWRDGGKPAETVVRMPLKELLEQLDGRKFAQVHRSVVVNLCAISHVKRHDNETGEIHLKGRADVLPVSRNYLHLFKQM